METALLRTFHAVPDPKLVVGVGDCAACGGIFDRSYASRRAVANILPVDFAVGGCPPEPRVILAEIMEAVRRRGRWADGQIVPGEVAALDRPADSVE